MPIFQHQLARRALVHVSISDSGAVQFPPNRKKQEPKKRLFHVVTRGSLFIRIKYFWIRFALHAETHPTRSTQAQVASIGC